MNNEKYVSAFSVKFLFNLKSRTSIFIKMNWLVKKGFIKKSYMNLPIKINLYQLTEMGVNYANFELGLNIKRKPFEMRGFNERSFKHITAIQQVKAITIKNNYSFEYPYFEKNKIMDAYIPEKRFAIEVELTVKSKDRYYSLLQSYFNMMIDRKIKIAKIIYIVPTVEMGRHIQTIFKEFKVIKLLKTDIITDNESFDNTVKFSLIENFESLINN